MRRLSLGLYAFALANILALALGHFALPALLHWEQQMRSASAMMQWALPLLNFDWSAITLAFAGTLSIFLLRPRVNAAAKRLASNAFAAYWVVHAAYLFAVPIPIPERLMGITLAIQIFPVLIAGLLLLGNVVFRSDEAD